MRHGHLDNYWYTVVPKILDELRRAGLMRPAQADGKQDAP
jgi:hypothetical protein